MIDNSFVFFLFPVAFILFFFICKKDNFIKLFYKSELDYNTLKSKPNQTKLLEKKHLFFHSLTQRERDQAVFIMESAIREKRVLTPKDKPYAEYSRSLQARFSSEVAFKFAQCHFKVFEEKGFRSNELHEGYFYSLNFQ
tara:strand:- start:94431 stop:94847 length:417 start_codon:yes stop_codon:yes gene_type:complete